MNYDIVVDQDTKALMAVIIGDNGKTLEVSRDHHYPSEEMFYWVADRLREYAPTGPCRMTRKKVYNERVYNSPGFWEITTYNARGDKLRSGQYSEVSQERHLQGLVQEFFGFPLQAAERIV